MSHQPMPMKEALEQVTQAIRAGHLLHGFRSGGGLRVMRLDQAEKPIAYGESISADEAMRHLGEDFKAGGREYEKVYGEIYPHYLTGSSACPSAFDAWIVQGYTIDARWCVATQDIEVILGGYIRDSTPPGCLEWAKTHHEGKYSANGITYSVRYNRNDGSHTTREISREPWAAEHQTFLYQGTRTGHGNSFSAALDWALVADAVPLLVKSA